MTQDSTLSVTFEKRGAVALVTLNRPQSLNSFTRQMHHDLWAALDQAEANLAQTVRQVRTLYANNSTLQAQVSLRSADLARAQADAARLQDDVNRRAPLMASGAVGSPCPALAVTVPGASAQPCRK